jgi:GNAT superfamily N-acetyltransferase
MDAPESKHDRAGPSDSEGTAAANAVALRPPRSGDYGWVVQRHGELYNREYGWDERFEGLTAEVIADFVRNFDASRDRGWIADRSGERLGCVFVVRHPKRDGVARLRLLLVEPAARGLGIGKRLVQACTSFAREAGYHTITLWTDSELTAARAIYAREGYRLVMLEPHHLFGAGRLAETWELEL